MLLDFSVENFGPFKERATLSMVRTILKDAPDTIIPNSDGVLSSALVFGPNGAGKSCLIEALASLQDIIGDQHAAIVRGYRPFRLSEESSKAPVKMEIRMIIDGVPFDYTISYLENAIVSESLHYYPDGRRTRVFVRTGPDELEFGDDRLIGKTGPDLPHVLASESIDACIRFRNEILEKIVILDGNDGNFAEKCCDSLADDPVRKGFAIRALETIGLGISDIVRGDGGPESEILVEHDVGTDAGRILLPLDVESSGTRAMIGIIGPLVDALLDGKTLVIDGFGTDLHPLVSRWLMGQFANTSNPNGAQLIACTHDLELMDTTELVRRDQIWFVNRNRETGESHLYGLADFNDTGKIKNPRIAYLIGRFEAIPHIRARGAIEE